MASQPIGHKKTFQVELWGEIQIVYDRYEEGRKTISELIRFFTDRVEADTSYAKDISKLVTKGYSVTERGSIGDLWNASKRSHEGLSKQCAELGSQIKRDVVAQLEVIKKNQGLQKDMLEKKVEKLVKDLAKSKKNWQEKYYACKKAAELALVTYDRAQSDPSMQTTKLSKLNTAQQQAKKEAEVAEAAYRMSIKEFNLTQAKYEEDMIKILQEFQEMEHKRIEAVQDAMQKYNMVLVSFATSLEQNRLLLFKATESVNGVSDVQMFIEDHKTGQSYPPPVEFEPYVDTAPALPAKPTAMGKSSPTVAISGPVSMGTTGRPKSEIIKKDEINQLGKSSPVKTDDAAQKRKEEEEKEKKRKDEEDRRRKEEEERRKKDEEEKKRKDEEEKKKKAELATSGKSDDRRDKKEKKITGKKESTSAKKEDSPKSPAVGKAAAAPVEKKAKALFDYKAGDDTELTFKMGDTITVLHIDESGWWDGTVGGKTGMFPGNYVELLKDEVPVTSSGSSSSIVTPGVNPATPAPAPALAPAPTSTPTHAPAPAPAPVVTAVPAAPTFVCGPGEKKVKILFNFEGSGEDELKVNEGDTVIIEEEVKGWYVGRNAKGQSGMFPANYAEDLK